MNLDQAGVVWVSPKKCKPLQAIEMEYAWSGLDGQDVHLVVRDADHRIYHRQTVKAGKGTACATFRAGGKAGVHHIELWTSQADGVEYHRHGGFRVISATDIHTDSDDINDLFSHVQEGILQAVDVSIIDGKRVTHAKHADNTRENLAYPIYSVSALRYFVADLKTMFDALYDYQYPNGSLPDHIYSDNYSCPLTTRRLRSCMADLEYGVASNACKGWEAHGDNQWMSNLLPKIEAGMEFVLSDPQMFDLQHGVIKRPHTLDEWDIHFTPDGEQGCFINDDTLFVITQNDTAGFSETCNALSEVYTDIGRPERANRWQMMRDHFRKLGNKLFWDGTKYIHHIHLDPFDHGDFDEANQLTMSNSWAITRGFADHSQSVSIIREYLRRQKETGDRFPWWSLQPGYPDHLKYFPDQDSWRKTQGNYANGGLFPWVGGELCRGAFQHGMESTGITLLTDFHSVLKRYNGALFTWYDLQGNAAINAPHNQTNFDHWGLYPWTVALIEELAGIKSDGKCFERVICSPRWPVTECRQVSACAHFPASDTYFAYSYELAGNSLNIDFTGTGSSVAFRILLPHGKKCERIMLDDQQIDFAVETIEQSAYAVPAGIAIVGAKRLVCTLGN